MPVGRPDGFENEIFVRHRDKRDVDPGKSADLARIHAAGVDHDLRLDLTLVGDDACDATLLDVDAGDSRRGVDLRPAPACALGERKRQLARIDVPVTRQVRGTENAVHGHRRKQLLRLRRGDQLERQPEGLRPAGLPGDLLHPLR